MSGNTVVVTSPDAVSVDVSQPDLVSINISHLGIKGDAGIQGPPGPSGGASAFTFDQSDPAMVWTIDHNLGHEPLISITDADGDEVECTVRNPTVNRTTATFSEAIAGRARLY